MTGPEIALAKSSRKSPLSLHTPPCQTSVSKSEKRNPRTPTLAEAIAPLAVLLLLLGIGSGVLGFRLEWMLLASALVAAAMAHRIGYTIGDMLRGIFAALRTVAPAMMIMLSVGVLIATWIACGTIPMLIYYGLHLTSARFFLVTASLVCSAISVCTGTSWGTMGTVGVALMGIARVLGIPLPAAAGAIVSGAYFGDKLSPLSDQTNLAPAVVGVKILDHIRWLLWTTGPAWLLALAIYLVTGFATKSAAPADMSGLETLLRANFHFSLVLLLPPLIMLWFVTTSRPTVAGMLLASGVAGVLAMAIQGQHVGALLYAAYSGYKPATNDPELNALLARGGLLTMGQVILLLLAAFSFAGVMVHCGFLARILRAILGESSGAFRLVASTVASGIVTGLVTGSSHLSIIVPGQLFTQAYRNANLAAKNLSRTMEDSGTVVVPLIPWSAAGVFATKTLGVATLHYLPWAVMNYTGVAFALLYAATGIGIARVTPESEDSHPDRTQ
jgi:NhaC family Na+:H+ antiporter